MDTMFQNLERMFPQVLALTAFITLFLILRTAERIADKLETIEKLLRFPPKISN